MLKGMPDYWKLSVRTRSRLADQGIRTFEELRTTPTRTLLEIRGFGAKCLWEVEDFVEKTTRDTDQRSTGSLDETEIKLTTGHFHVGFDRLTDLTRECLEEAGIMDEAGIGESTLDEVLGALMYDQESVDELWKCCGVPKPSRIEEFLSLLSTSRIARERLEVYLYNNQRAYRELLTGCTDLVRDQVGDGALHPLALMNFMPLQSVNGLLRPPARDLDELLSLAERGAVEISGAALRKVEASLKVRSLGDELQELLGVLDERELHVLRGRYAPLRQTLEAVARGLDVSRERVRQIQVIVKQKLDEAYRIELPLPRLRSAMLTISEERAFSIEQMRSALISCGIVREEENLDDFLAIWGTLESEDTNVTDHHHQWQVIDREAYRFPEDIRLMLKTGYTQAQQEIVRILMPIVKKRCSRSGGFVLSEVLSTAFGDQPPEDGDVMRVLLGHGCSRVSERYWIGPADGYTVLHTVARKMLDCCGPLDIVTLRQGIVRHQKRHRVTLPPLEVVDALLRQRSDIRLEDAQFRTIVDPVKIQSLGRQEEIWLKLIEEDGPVVTFGQIAAASSHAGLSRVSAAVLAASSELVVRYAPNRYCLPGQEPDAWEISGAARYVDSSVQYGLLEQGLEIAGSVRARLTIDLENSYALKLYVSESRWPGEAEVSFSWNGAESTMRTRYLAYDDVTIAGPHSATVAGPEWDEVAILSGPDSFMSLNVPASSTKRSLVFLASDGRQVKNWREGQEHLVLIAGDAFDEDQATLLFDHYDVLDSPEGWETHRFLRVNVRTSLTPDVSELPEADREKGVLQLLETAAHSMGLPSVKLLHRIRNRLLGPQVPETGGADGAGISESASSFTTSRLPTLEIRGLWDGILSVALYRIESGSGRRHETRVGSLTLTPDWRVQTVDLWEGRPAPGLYKISTEGCEDLLFEIVRDPAPDGRVMDVRLSSGVDPTTGGETLVVRAWPKARLWLTVTCGASWRRSLPLEVGESGRWQGDLPGLGIVDLPADGEIVVSVSWKNLVNRNISVRDHARSSGVPRFAWSEVLGERVLALQGSRGEDGLAVLNGDTFVLGERPWLGEIWEPVVRGLPGGGRAVVVPNAVSPTWAVELSDTEPKEARLFPVYSQPKTIREPRFGIGDLLGEYEDAPGTESWQEVSGALRNSPLPPALRQKLGVGELSEILRTSVIGFPTRPRWTPLSESLLAELEEWSKYGLELPVVAFAPGAGPENELGVRSGIAALTANGATLAVKGESVLFYRQKDGSVRPSRTTVHHRRDGNATNRNTHYLSVGETLYVCLGCGLYLQPKEFNYHEPVIDGQPSCRSIRSAYRTVSSGVQAELELWVYRDPTLYIRAYENLVRRVSEGEDAVPESAEPWLEQVVDAFNTEARNGEEPGQWFARASNVLLELKQLTERLGRDREREALLADRGWASRSRRKGIEIVSRWVQSEIGGR